MLPTRLSEPTWQSVLINKITDKNVRRRSFFFFFLHTMANARRNKQVLTYSWPKKKKKKTVYTLSIKMCLLTEICNFNHNEMDNEYIWHDDKLNLKGQKFQKTKFQNLLSLTSINKPQNIYVPQYIESHIGLKWHEWVRMSKWWQFYFLGELSL